MRPMMHLALPLLAVMFGCIAAPFAQNKEPIRITAETLEVQHSTGQATFSGNVKLVQGGLTLTANRLNARYGNGLETLTASGNVQFVRGNTETASGDTAIYEPTTQTLTLTGNKVTLQRGPSTLVGDKLVYNLATQVARVTKQGGPVEATFVQQN